MYWIRQNEKGLLIYWSTLKLIKHCYCQEWIIGTKDVYNKSLKISTTPPCIYALLNKIYEPNIMHLKYLSTRPNLNSRLGGEIKLTTKEKRLKN
jgi:hypothetical protein